MTEPVELGGGIAGPGGPWDKGATVIVDTRGAVILDEISTALFTSESGRGLALVLAGRVNHTERRASVGFLMPPDVAGKLVADISHIFLRHAYLAGTGAELEAFTAAYEAQMDTLTETRPDDAKS